MQCSKDKKKKNPTPWTSWESLWQNHSWTCNKVQNCLQRTACEVCACMYAVDVWDKTRGWDLFWTSRHRWKTALSLEVCSNIPERPKALERGALLLSPPDLDVPGTKRKTNKVLVEWQYLCMCDGKHVINPHRCKYHPCYSYFWRNVQLLSKICLCCAIKHWRSKIKSKA